MSFLEDLRRAADYEYGIGSEENRAVMYEARKRKELQPDAPKLRQMFGSYRTPQVLREVVGLPPDKQYEEARKDYKLGIDVSTPGKKAGSLLGAVGADITQDAARRFWWLLNAAQAVGEVGAEETFAQSNKDLYAQQPSGKWVYDKKGNQVPLMVRKYPAGYVQALSIPAGIAINTGLGLMTPFGGAEGYKAALPSEEDPSKTSNVIGEVGLKYFMGKTGNLLPYDEFVKVRPDVSPEEYRAYKAFKYDKKEDWNPLDDGKMSILGGTARYTDEGIHGPEVQFLGRSLPVTTGLVPYAGALVGGAMGVRGKRPIRDGFFGSVLGLGIGDLTGNIIEQERRRRNTAENAMDGTLS